MAANTRVLLIGGNGKIARLLTPLMLKRSWKVLSLIRESDQEPDIRALGVDYPEQLETLVHSLEEVKSEEQAQVILSSTRPNYIVWSAGAGGKGGPERTDAIDRLACTSFIGAAAASKSVTKFLLISYLGSRRNIAPWWTSEEWESTQRTNHGVLKTYYPAKLASDESLNIASKRRGKILQVSVSDLQAWSIGPLLVLYCLVVLELEEKLLELMWRRLPWNCYRRVQSLVGWTYKQAKSPSPKL